MSQNRLIVFSGNANRPLADEICANLEMNPGRAMVRQFSDGETYLQIQENVRGADVFIIQPTCTPVDRHLMELLLMIDALKRASAGRITAALPYYGYARQDRGDVIPVRGMTRLTRRARSASDLTVSRCAQRPWLVSGAGISKALSMPQTVW